MPFMCVCVTTILRRTIIPPPEPMDFSTAAPEPTDEPTDKPTEELTEEPTTDEPTTDEPTTEEPTEEPTTEESTMVVRAAQPRCYNS